jgi:hypothetical protein
VRTRETSTSEPPPKCRKRRNVVETEWLVVSSGQAQRKPVYWLSGDRHIGGVNLVQALVRNAGTCRLDAKGAVSSGSPTST